MCRPLLSNAAQGVRGMGEWADTGEDGEAVEMRWDRWDSQKPSEPKQMGSQTDRSRDIKTETDWMIEIYTHAFHDFF